MESLLGMSLARFLSRLTTEPLVVLKTVLLYLWLKYLSKYRRFDLYDPLSKDLTKNDAVIPSLEHQIEKPSRDLRNNKSDVILVYCGNVTGDRLVARVSREKENHVAWLYVRLADGRNYRLPHPEKSYPPNDGFVAGGLKIECQLPMRKWRISFNGLLREFNEISKESRVVHIKLSFLCKPSSYPFDLSTDIHPIIMADFLAKESGTMSLLAPSSVLQYLDSYIQSSQLFGSISVDGGEETELYIWGARKRTREIAKPKGLTRMDEFIGYTRDGQLVYSGELSLSGFKTSLPFAFYLERTSLSSPVIRCRNRITTSKSSISGLTIDIQTVRSSLRASVETPSQTINFRGFGLDANCHLTKFTLQDGDVGHGIYLRNTWDFPRSELLEKPSWKFGDIEHGVTGSIPAVLPLDDPRCRNTSLSGGKGASLSALTYLARKYKTNFKVPGGFVLTTEAYKEFLVESGMQSDIQQFQANAWSFRVEKIQETCNQIEEKLSKTVLTERLKIMVQKQFREQFSTNEDTRRFAVRSSASGEDSEEMSAAGQMTTILGVQGLQNIYEAVAVCWASQFSFTAVQYKRQNGQELNSPMAVVVQEMVPADTAGVLFTRDPVTGNPQNVTITANYGLGESVVSASAEPDTLVMERDEDNRVQLKSTRVGKKKTKIVMGEEGNVLEEMVEEDSTSNCCISEKQAQILTEAALKIEETYGFPLDLEWAFKENLLYMLQARPITTFDKESHLELCHSSSQATRAEDEYNTKANVGEVMPGATSAFSTALTTFHAPICIQILYAHRNKYFLVFNPFFAQFSCFYNHIFISMPQFILRFYKKGVQTFLSEANIYAGFGRKLDDEDMLDQADKRNRMYPPNTSRFQILYFIADFIFGERRLNKAIAKYSDQEIDMSQYSNSKDMYLHLCSKTLQIVGQGLGRHLESTTNSTIMNNLVLGLLANDNKGWDVKVFSDFALILSCCGKLESADIPRMTLWVVEEIKKSIEVERFRAMTAQEACDWLEKTDTSAGKAFKEFIRKHGHRCWKEFDVYSKPWRINKLPLVKNFQETLAHDNDGEKTFITSSEVVERLQVKVSWKSKLLLKILIPLCRRAVFNREKSKSLAIKLTDNIIRKGSWFLAEQLSKEGRLPDKDLMFFLNMHEVYELIETRSPSLVQRAIRRKKIIGYLDNLKFPEICKGIPKPLNTQRTDFDADLQNSDLELIGTPVSQGTAAAYARVAIDLEEAAKIQPGEILIAYGTDIAWSPYFPMLSGVATELGGLISHGAVVAREYGLPCVVGVFDATSKFRTGDYVYLDGNKGILKRIKAPEKD